MRDGSPLLAHRARVFALLWTGVLAATTTLTPRSSAQEPDATAAGDTGAFLEGARRAAERFARQESAIGEGYRSAGIETPAGGHTFLNTSHLIHRTLAADQPTGLSYVHVDGEARLAAVLWALPEDEDVSLEPIPSSAWRRVGDCDAAAGGLPRAPDAFAAGSAGGCLVAARAWVGLGNPSGTLAWDNWTLPLVRAGLPVTPGYSEEGGRAVSLGADPAGFLSSLPPRERAYFEPLVRAWACKARVETARLKSLPPNDIDLKYLAEIWRGFCESARERVEPRSAEAETAFILARFGCAPAAVR